MFTALIVDDDPLLCNAMRLKIDLVNQESQLGLDEVITANSAYEAYSMMQKKHTVRSSVCKRYYRWFC